MYYVSATISEIEIIKIRAQYRAAIHSAHRDENNIVNDRFAAALSVISGEKLNVLHVASLVALLTANLLQLTLPNMFASKYHECC